MEEDKLIASVAGVVEKVNKLISVRPLKSRYVGVCVCVCVCVCVGVCVCSCVCLHVQSVFLQFPDTVVKLVMLSLVGC